MKSQFSLGARALSRATRRAGAADLSDAQLESAFKAQYLHAVEEAGHGRSVSPAAQLERAGVIIGRQPSVESYLAELRDLVQATPFQRAAGALELLESLAQDGYSLAVISNTIGEPGAALWPVLKSFELDRFVSTFMFSDEHPWTKPAPEIFAATLRRLEEPASQAVHVGDGWSDLEGARRAGFRAGILFTGLQEYGAEYRQLFAPSPKEEPPAPHQAVTLGEVGDLVRKLLPPRSSSSTL